jgi:tRNA(Ile)-lysidine synthase
MPANALPPKAIERFRADLERLTGEAPERLGIAVSGGPDSLALLLLAHAAYGNRVETASVDHGLRQESRSEAEFVARICAKLGCGHSILTVEVRPKGEGLQGEARRARYAALEHWAAERGISILCTAHHADDQAETILMRLQRGSGIAGLSGIRAVRKLNPSLTLIRPLLGWTRAELSDLVRGAGLTAVDDPSNRDTRFDRVAMREFLANNPQFEPRRLARSAAALTEAEEALGWAADRLAEERCTVSGNEWRIDTARLPREMKRRLLVRAITKVRRESGIEPEWTGSEDVEGLLSTLEAGGVATLAGVMVRADRDSWRLNIAPFRRNQR